MKTYIEHIHHSDDSPEETIVTHSSSNGALGQEPAWDIDVIEVELHEDIDLFEENTQGHVNSSLQALHGSCNGI